MKKLIQISLIVVLLFVVVQAAAGGSVVSSNQNHLGTASNISSSLMTIPEGAHAVACLVAIKGVICVTPNVGWNS